MKIAIMGAGAVGGYFGALLARAGLDVAFIARGAHLEAIRKDGLYIDTTEERNFHIPKPTATDNPADIGSVDLVIVATKTYHIEAAAKLMKPMVGPDTTVLPLQNGVEATEQLAVHFPDRVLGGLTWIFSEISRPGVVRHWGYGKIDFGELDTQPRERSKRIQNLFEAAGISHELAPDINVNRWRKFMTVCPFSSLSAVTRATNDVLMDIPETRQMWYDALVEIDRLGRAQGVNLPDDLVQATFEFAESWPAGSTPSMMRDITTGHRSELESQPGYVARKSVELGLAAPIHTFCYNTLLPQEAHTRKAT